MADYNQFISRNSGYISSEVQDKIKNCRLFIAGCGIGSQVAIALTHLGFTRFTLIDGDEISVTNLNRQAYDFSQIGKNKGEALKENILSINPDCDVKVIAENFGPHNSHILKDADFIFDTIDFLDLGSIILLHETAEAFKVPLISGMSLGWGACCMYFSNAHGAKHQFREVFRVAQEEDKSGLSYVQKFRELFYALSGHIDPQVVTVMDKTFQSMLDNKPCPAPQVAAGAFSLAALMSTTMVRIFKKVSVPEAPNLILLDLYNMVGKSVLPLDGKTAA